MQFRKDINGLRAIAVIAVVLFHFNPSWMPGGFAGVDVFFVISGFLMTGIIFRGIEQENFSILKFYVARANRIIPALALLCLVMLLFGWFYLTPPDYKTLGLHVASSMGFLSNFTYWTEAGYFDAASHEKWLLHTWSLSVEWQFYLIYPLLLVAMRKFMSIKAMKTTILFGTVFGFMFCVFATYTWPELAYFLLPTRAWEMMLGGVAYLYPFAKHNRNKYLEWLGIGLIVSSYFLISAQNPWPGYLAIFPVVGSFLIIQAQRNDSLLTSNIVFQKLGTWSYSIYLWHWPLVVAMYYFSLHQAYIYLGIVLSALLGWLSSTYIEKIKFNNNFSSLKSYFKCKPIYIALVACLAGGATSLADGFLIRTPAEYQNLINHAQRSPYKNKCHINKYQEPAQACEYFTKDIKWTVFGDSHASDIAYALGLKLQPQGIGLKQFSFSACKPSYLEPASFNRCAKWYNETVNYILDNKKIENVIFNHRFTAALFDGDAANYPANSDTSFLVTDEVIRITKHLDQLIRKLAENKQNVYVIYPIPELPKHINQLVGEAYRSGASLTNIVGTSVDWYEQRNQYFIDHFDNANYPHNVHLLNPRDIFCDTTTCYAVRDGMPLYSDDDHPSILAASKIIELIE
jgi:peptidoglycan/LPS O-acetylase OafA/YrhL